MTEWVLSGPALVSAAIALASSGSVYASILLRRRLTPGLLVGGDMYALFILYVVVRRGSGCATRSL